METSDWKIITCPHCANLVKVAGHLASSKLACPTCRMPIPIHPVAPPASPPAHKAVLPSTRAFDPTPVRLRGADKEAWETKAPDLREIDFKDRLAKTTDYNGSQEMVTPVRRRRSFTKAESLTAWEDGKHRSRRHRGGRWWMVKKFFRRYSLLLAAILLAFAGILYRLNDLRSSGTDSTYEQTPPPPPVPREQKLLDLELQSTVDILRDIRPVLEKFLGAKSPADFRLLVRDPERVIPLMDAYYSQQKPFAPADFRQMPESGDLITYKQFVVASMETKNFRSYFITLEKTPAGYFVDWESYVGYGEMPLATFMKDRPAKPILMRFDIRPIEYYNLDFQDRQGEFQSYQLDPPDGAAPLYGYVRRGSAAHDKISTALIGAKNTPCVLTVRYQENSTQERQVEISEFVQKGYVIRAEDMPPPVKSDLSPPPLKSETPPSANPPGR